MLIVSIHNHLKLPKYLKIINNNLISSIQFQLTSGARPPRDVTDEPDLSNALESFGKSLKEHQDTIQQEFNKYATKENLDKLSQAFQNLGNNLGKTFQDGLNNLQTQYGEFTKNQKKAD
ncbi:uncharacterized protein LOC116336861 [Contarinia nasturtii]|uniref:uncharacterized protein LOC116336861 n=1 Tax=Contarinia nasturtii TaxID=265458 RepID=UPI0012D48F5B|nr:uncharacterized protein LOC116336861 [Contarinia nasturtii]